MREYVTYLELLLNPNSVPPTQIASELRRHGWIPVWGRYDFALPWDGKWDWEDSKKYWKKINATHKILKKLKVSYSFRTFERGKEDAWVWWNQ